MAGTIDFSVEKIDEVRVTGLTDLAKRDLMSPYVWQEDDGSFAMMVRVVDRGPSATTGSIYYGTGTTGRHFAMRARPVISPGPGGGDVGGCEDPTVVKWRGRYYVYYTGVEKTRRSGTLLNIAIFCITLAVQGRDARQAMMCGWMPTSSSFLSPSCAALDFCSPSICGSMMYVSATWQTLRSPSSKASSRRASM